MLAEIVNRHYELIQPIFTFRLVSQTVHYNEQKLDPKYTLMLMQWGQFIDHDLTHTPMLRGFHNTILECGTCTSKVSF